MYDFLLELPNFWNNKWVFFFKVYLMYLFTRLAELLEAEILAVFFGGHKQQ